MIFLLQWCIYIYNIFFFFETSVFNPRLWWISDSPCLSPSGSVLLMWGWPKFNSWKAWGLNWASCKQWALDKYPAETQPLPRDELPAVFTPIQGSAVFYELDVIGLLSEFAHILRDVNQQQIKNTSIHTIFPLHFPSFLVYVCTDFS